MRKNKPVVIGMLLCMGLLIIFSANAGAVSKMVVISSASYAGKGNPWCSKTGVAVNSAGNIIVTGNKSNGSDQDIQTIMYDDDWTVIGSATHDGITGGEWDGANAVVVDDDDNIIVIG